MKGEHRHEKKFNRTVDVESTGFDTVGMCRGTDGN